MALSEPEILRYSRQILLGPVGGAGQERLKQTAAQLAGEGGALEVARLYLQAGGTPVQGGVDRSERAELRSGAGHHVVVGALAGAPAALFRRADACEACFEASARDVQPSPDAATDVLLGALAALAYQRLVLGLGEPMGALRVSAEGRVEPVALAACEAHR